MELLNWTEFNINTFFDISYGNKLDMCQMEETADGIHFVTRTATNNGIGGYVKVVNYAESYPARCLTVALGGSIGSTFLQQKIFYTSQNVAVLKPKLELSDEVLLFVATLIQKESEKRFVAFGRELNKHIKVDFTIKLPAIKGEEPITPDWNNIELFAKKYIISILPSRSRKVFLGEYDRKPILPTPISLNNSKWDWFSVKDIFPIIEKCKCSNATEFLEDGDDIAYIGAKKSNNGVMRYVNYDESLITKGNCIVFIGDGQGSVGYCTYQPNDFIGSTTLLAGYSKHLNVYVAQFLITVLDLERYRYSFGRKYKKDVIKSSRIKLPATQNGDPDWNFMENYIKSLPYSSNI
ncbi:MAG: restriction endonuclease subunit S [Alistipes sp.]